MELVRNLPASESAPDLARPAVDLAVGRRLAPPVADEVRALADELLGETASHPSAQSVELRVRSDPRSVRLEVAWMEGPTAPHLRRPETGDTQWARARERIERLADRWGLTRRGDHRCLWAEKSTEGTAAERSA